MAEINEVQCPCCGLFYARRNPKAFPSRTIALDPRSGFCWDCANHQGHGEQVVSARGRHHGKMLRREYQAAREEVVAARQEVEEMRRELAMRPVQTVIRVENLDELIVDTAERERDDAYHRRDVAMGALSDVRRLHRKDKDKRHCVCGLNYDRCEMAQIVDRWGGVESWELSQSFRAQRGERHYLDREHPALTDKDYFGEFYSS